MGIAQLSFSFGRQLKTTVPITIEQQSPKLSDTSKLIQNQVHLKNCLKQKFYDHHSSKSLSPLPLGTTVFVPDCLRIWTGPVSHQAIAPTLFPPLVGNFNEIDDPFIPLSKNANNILNWTCRN